MHSTDFQFGSSQVQTSERMRKRPLLSKIVFVVFGYTSVGNYARSRVFKKLLAQLPIEKFTRIIDLGAGLGEYTFGLARHLPNAEFTAIEILKPRIDALERVVHSQNFKNVEVFPHKIESLSKNGQFDFIFSVDVFEHILKEEMPFDQCFQKLKSGGYLLVKMPNIVNRTILPHSFFGEHNDWLDKEHVGQVYDLEGLKERFTKAGFKVTYASYADGILARAGWELAYFSKKLGSAVQLLTLPVCKLLVILDGLSGRRTRGNTIQVIGQKP